MRTRVITLLTLLAVTSSYSASDVFAQTPQKKRSTNLAARPAKSEPKQQAKPYIDWSKQWNGVAPQAVKFAHAGRAHLAREHFDKALVEFDKAVKVDAKVPIYEDRARCYAEEGRYADAATDLKKAIAQVPSSPRYKFLGEVYSAQNLNDLAIQAFTAAIKIDVNDFWCYKNRGDIYLRLKNYKLAIADYSKLIEQAPKEPVGYNCRAKAYNESGRQDLADKDYKKVRGLLDAEELF